MAFVIMTVHSNPKYTATQMGSYYEIMHVRQNPIANETYCVGVRYEVDTNGNRSWKHAGWDTISGNATKQACTDNVKVLPGYVTLVGATVLE
jgi:hypothetical protein